jgi:RNA polymerase sigma-70 factor, ECF subfamily
MTTGIDDAELIDRARGGDRLAFEAVIAPHRRALRAHAYRMLGSPEDADDVVQDALLRAWQAFAGFAGRATVKTWLYRIVTHCAIDHARSRPRRWRADDVDGPGATATAIRGDAPMTDAEWLLPYPDAAAGEVGPGARYDLAQSLSLAFCAALQAMPPRQRAVLLLRDVVGMSAAETAETLEDSVSAVNALLDRARRAVPDPAPAPPRDERVRDLVERYVRALLGGDVPGLLAIIRDDVAVAMPPNRMWIAGREAFAAFHTASPFAARVHAGLTAEPITGAGLPGCAFRNADGSPFAVAFIDARPDGIARIDAFVFPRLVDAWPGWLA